MWRSPGPVGPKMRRSFDQASLRLVHPRRRYEFCRPPVAIPIRRNSPYLLRQQRSIPLEPPGDIAMAKETAELAHYAASCRYEDIPTDVIERAKQCITDTIAAVIFGYHLPWSRIVVAFAQKNGVGGNSRVLCLGGPRVHAPAAALANGALAHAFES